MPAELPPDARPIQAFPARCRIHRILPSTSAGRPCGMRLTPRTVRPLLACGPIRPLLLLGVALACASAPIDAGAQSVELRHRLDEGMDLRYEMTQNTAMHLPGGMGSMDQEMTQQLRIQVVSVDADGNARMRSTVESVRMETRGPMGTQRFDSAEGTEPADPTMRPLAAMVGMASEVVIGPDGAILEVGDMDEIIESMLEGFSPEERAMMEEAFDEEMMANMFSQSFQLLPQGPVAPGHSWDHSISIPTALGTITSEFLYTLESVEPRGGSDVATIRVSGTTGALEPDPANPIAGMIELDGGEISGGVEFDATRGVVLRSTVTTRMRMGMMGEEMESVTEMDFRLLP